MIELCKFWLLEFKEQRQYYLNGSFRFLLHKTNLTTSPSLMNQIRTFKGDCTYYKDNKRIISAANQMSEQFEDALYKITRQGGNTQTYGKQRFSDETNNSKGV